MGLILRALEPELTTGFFLHIPFGLNDEFMEQYAEQGLAIVRGLLAFNRVGFQTCAFARWVLLVMCGLDGGTWRRS